MNLVSNIKRIILDVGGFNTNLFLYLLSLSISSILFVSFGVIIKSFIDYKANENLWLISCIFIFSRLAIPVINSGKDYLFNKWSNDIQDRSYNNFLSFNLRRKNSIDSATFLRKKNYLAQIEPTLRASCFSCLGSYLDLVLTCLMVAFLVDSFIALSFFILSNAFILVSLLLTNRRKKLVSSMFQLEKNIENSIINTINNAGIITAFKSAQSNISLFRKKHDKLVSVRLESQYSLCKNTFILSSTYSFICMVIFALCTQIEHYISNYVLIMIFLSQLYLPLNLIAFSIRQIQRSSMMLDELFPDITTSFDYMKSKNEKFDEIIGRGVTVSLENKDIFREIDFLLRFKKINVIGGVNGIGKSTLLRAICGELEPSNGNMYSKTKGFEQNLLEDDSGFLYLPQATSLFNDGLRDTLSRLIDVDLELIIQNEKYRKYRLNRLFDFQHINEELSLSPGQVKCFLIVLLLIKTDFEVFLDEPTSGMDMHKSTILSSILNEMRDDYFIIVVSHDNHFLQQLEDKNLILIKK